MTKQEIDQAIKNGESVWCVYKDQSNIYEIKAVEIEKVLSNTFLWGKEYYSNIKDVFKTKAEAEHYLHHANITRTEQLPFYTFSEIAKDEKNFKMGKTYTLIEDKNFVLDINKSYVSQIVLYTGKEKYSWNFNEENFYKAYDECVRLFRSEEL